MATSDEYLLSNQQAEAGARFQALSALFDPVTTRHLERVGLAAGWRCWEVGAGGPTIPTWLAERVGPSGYVLATDIDTSWLGAGNGYDVLGHDIGRDPPPGEGFDLIHTRLVLVHVPTRDDALERLVGALKPGGWLVVEEADPLLQPLACPDEVGPAEALANRLRSGFRELMVERGPDLAFGRTLARRLRNLGLLDVEADAFFPLSSPACIALERATVLQIRTQLLDNDLATDEEIEAHLTNLDAGAIDPATAPLISTWGRRAR